VAANDRSVAPDRRTLKRLRIVLWLVVLLLAVVAVILYAVSRPSGRVGAPVVPVSTAPAATWAAGALRAPGFRLEDATGRSLSLASFRGRPVIVTFIDPLCRDYCPTEAKHLNDVVNSFTGSTKPAIVAVSVNAEGNAPRTLAQDGRKWQLVPQWHWGVGARSRLSRVWDAYNIQVVVSSQTVAGVPVRQIGHTEAAYVVDANGFQRALFIWPYSASGVVSTLRELAPS
jgi:protein SCO1/2